MENLKNATSILIGCWIGSRDNFQSLIDGYSGLEIVIPFATLGLTLLGVFYVVDLIFNLPRVIREYLRGEK